MILVLFDDGVLKTYDTIEGICRDVEALDVEETLKAVCDDCGQRYEVEWVKPNKKSWWGWIVLNGVYRLRPQGLSYSSRFKGPSQIKLESIAGSLRVGAERHRE
jgi:exonuclease I